MPYRSLARNEHAELDNAEIAVIADQARTRVRRVGFAVAGAFALFFASAIAAGSTGRATQELHCHHVTIVYEATDHTPPPPATRTVCEWR